MGEAQGLPDGCHLVECAMDALNSSINHSNIDVIDAALHQVQDIHGVVAMAAGGVEADGGTRRVRGRGGTDRGVDETGAGSGRVVAREGQDGDAVRRRDDIRDGEVNTINVSVHLLSVLLCKCRETVKKLQNE